MRRKSRALGDHAGHTQRQAALDADDAADHGGVGIECRTPQTLTQDD
jgi:hypothetical protein